MPEPRKQTPTSYRSLKTAVVGEHNIPFQNVSLVVLEVPLNRHEVKKILPLGFWPANPPMATLFFADYPIFPYGLPYREAVMMVHVRTPLGKGLHCIWILVDDDVALIGGREFLGYPKKLGEITFVEKSSTISVNVTRRGVNLLSAEARRKAPEDTPSPVFGYKTFNLRGPTQIFTINPVLCFKPKEVIHESFKAETKLEFNDSIFDPIAGLVAGAPRNARIVYMDILLPAEYIFPLGYTGGWRWFLNTFNMRYR